MIAKELTKIHEELFRGDINNIKTFKSSLKGEVTLVVSSGKIKEKLIKKKEIINKIKKYLKKYSLKDTVDLIIESEKVNKKEIYKLCLKIKNEKNF